MISFLRDVDVCCGENFVMKYQVSSLKSYELATYTADTNFSLSGENYLCYANCNVHSMVCW